jgi:hypothetical protein
VAVPFGPWVVEKLSLCDKKTEFTKKPFLFLAVTTDLLVNDTTSLLNEVKSKQTVIMYVNIFNYFVTHMLPI